MTFTSTLHLGIDISKKDFGVAFTRENRIKNTKILNNPKGYSALANCLQGQGVIVSDVQMPRENQIPRGTNKITT